MELVSAAQAKRMYGGGTHYVDNAPRAATIFTKLGDYMAKGSKLVLSMGRHSYKDGVLVSKYGKKQARKTGKNRIKGHNEEDVSFVRSPLARTYQTAEQLAKGAGLKHRRIATDKRLYSISDRTERQLEKDIKKAGGKSQYLKNLIGHSDSDYEQMYNTVANPILHYIRDAVKNHAWHSKKGQKKRVESVSHGVALDAALVEVLRRNGEDIGSIEDIGGAMNELDNFEITVNNKSRGKPKISLKYKGRSWNISPEALGIDDSEALEDVEDGATIEGLEGLVEGEDYGENDDSESDSDGDGDSDGGEE